MNIFMLDMDAIDNLLGVKTAKGGVGQEAPTEGCATPTLGEIENLTMIKILLCEAEGPFA